MGGRRKGRKGEGKQGDLGDQGEEVGGAGKDGSGDRFACYGHWAWVGRSLTARTASLVRLCFMLLFWPVPGLWLQC